MGCLTSRKQGPEHLYKQIRGLCLVGVDPDVLKDLRVLLCPVEEALGTGALKR
jgi:hypothetical protein